MEPRPKVVFAACAVVLVVCASILTFRSDEEGARTAELLENIYGDHDDFVDPALLRLTNDEWFTTTTDKALEDAAEHVARARLSDIIMARVHRMTHGYPADIEKITRVAEEQIMYDKTITHKLEQEIAYTISPGNPRFELPVVRALEEKLKARIMHTLSQEAIREINLLVDATGENPSVKEMTKNHLIEKTTDMLVPQVEGRVRRFVQSRVKKNAHLGLVAVLRYLAHSVDEEEKRELLGGPLVPNVDYTFRGNNEKNNQEESTAVAAKVATDMKMAPKGIKLAKKTALGDVAPASAEASSVQTPQTPQTPQNNNAAQVQRSLASALLASVALLIILVL